MSERSAHPIGYYLCVKDVNLRRGDDDLGVVFTSGQVYPFLRFDYKDAVLVNNANGEHLMAPDMLKDRFRRMPADFVPEVKETNDEGAH